MERAPIFRDRQEVTPDDLNNIPGFAGAEFDHLRHDAIEAGRRFTGFVVTAATATSVNVGDGRLWFDGAVYFRDEDDGVVIDLLAQKPPLLKRIVAIVAAPQTVEVDPQDRDFEIDAETLDFEGDSVNMERRRHARLEAIPGAEAVSPVAPVVDASAVVVAFVTMGTGGIETVERNEAKVLRRLSDVADDVDTLELFRDAAEPQISALKSDLTRLAFDLANAGNKELLLNTAADVASIKARLDIPDTYAGYRALTFLDDGLSDDEAAGYDARIEEGLRFPYEAEDSQELALLNPNQANVKVSAGGLLLPLYTELERRITKGDNGTLNLNEYSNQESRTLVRLGMSRERIRYASDFEVVVGSAWWSAGTYVDRLNGSIRGVFQRAGETFQVYDTGRVDAEGHQIVRLSRYWTDSVAQPYWGRVTTEVEQLGYAHVETFLNAQDRIVTRLGPHMKGKPAAGSMIVGVCETFRNSEPDFSRIITMTTVNAADVQLAGVAGAFPSIAVEPHFQKGGERYGYFIVTQHPFQIGVCDAQTAAAQGVTGTYYYGLNGGAWFPEPSVHMLWRDWSAQFEKARYDVDLQALQLAGGIQSIDMMADAIVPGSTDLVLGVQLGGVWRALDQFDPTILDTLPTLLPSRLTFNGTKDVMPMVRLPDSTITVGRLATAAKHVSVAKALSVASDVIVMKARLRGFDPVHHTFTPKISYGVGPTVETADTITTVTHADGVVEKVATFNLAAPTDAYVSITEMGTDSAQVPYTVAEQIEVAE